LANTCFCQKRELIEDRPPRPPWLSQPTAHLDLRHWHWAMIAGEEMLTKR
jgi:hypothetical protein